MISCGGFNKTIESKIPIEKKTDFNFFLLMPCFVFFFYVQFEDQRKRIEVFFLLVCAIHTLNFCFIHNKLFRSVCNEKEREKGECIYLTNFSSIFFSKKKKLKNIIFVYNQK